MASRPKTSSQRKQESKQTRKRTGNPPATMPKSNKTLIIALVGVIVIVAVAAVVFLAMSPSEPTESNTPSGNDGNTNTTANPVAVFDTTLGTFKVELFEDKMPITVANFVDLANDGFYDGLVFHRIGDGFMIQGGAYDTEGEYHSSDSIEFESSPDVTHVDGAISMASTGAGVGGSNQFFICDGAQSFLDGNYAAFGVVTEGITVIRDIADQDHDNSNGDGTGWPVENIIINSITIE